MSAELEQAVLGATLQNSNTIPALATKLTPNDFHDPRNAVVWKAVLGQWGEGKPVDPVAVLTRLQEQGDANRVGGAPYLFELVSVAAIPATIEHHADKIRGQAASRRLNTAGQQIQQLAESMAPTDALGEAQKLLDGVLTVQDGEVVRIGDTLDTTLDAVQAMQDGEVPRGLATGFEGLDELTGGLRGGQMVIVAARPGVGKSTIAVDIMRHTSIHSGIPSLIFSLEMSKDEINQRIISAESEVHLAKIRSGNLNQQDWVDVGKAAQRIETAPIYMDDTGGLSMMDIVAKAKMNVQQHDIGLIVIDYLQLIRAENTISREQEVAGYSRAMKLLAKACNVPVIVVAQVNREVTRRGDDAKIKPSDLRESGALEQDADIILLINRFDQEDPDHQRAGEVDVDVAKNRGGKTGAVTLANRLHFAQFANM